MELDEILKDFISHCVIEHRPIGDEVKFTKTDILNWIKERINEELIKNTIHNSHYFKFGDRSEWSKEQLARQIRQQALKNLGVKDSG